MISGFIFSERKPKKFLFWTGYTQNFDHSVCSCDNGAKFSLTRYREGLECVDEKGNLVASLDLTDTLVRKKPQHKRLELLISTADGPTSTFFFEKGGRYLCLDGISDPLYGPANGEISTKFCSYTMRNDFSALEFTCFEDRHLLPVLVGLYATTLQEVLQSTNSNALF